MVLYLSSQREPLKSKKVNIAGWSSLVARRAHNPKVVGSNPAPATTKHLDFIKMLFLFCIQNERPHSCAAPRLRLYLLQHPVPTLFGFQLLIQGRLAVVEQEVFVVLEIPLTAVFGNERMGGG